MKKLSFEEVWVGMEIPPLVKQTSTLLSARWAGASGDYDPIHYDNEYAISRKLPTSILNGRLKVALLIQLVTNWVGAPGLLRKISVQHRGMDLVGEPVTCKGRVIDKYVREGENLVECEIWAENPKGERTAPGAATVALP